MDDKNTNTIIDAQIVDPQVGTSVDPNNTVPSGDTLINLTGLIQNYIASIDRQKHTLTEHRQMLSDSFMNDETYKAEAEKVKAATKIRNQVKQQILKQPQLMALSAKIKDLNEELKASKEALSSYLQDYQKLTGANEIEDANGNLNEIVYTARLIKPSKFGNFHG